MPADIFQLIYSSDSQTSLCFVIN